MQSRENKSNEADIENTIRLVRGCKVILDVDLANIYGVTTKRLNEQLRRNPDRFPNDFAFQLTGAETESLRSQIATSKTGRGGRRYRPYGFTEHGALMAANVLNSSQAVMMSVHLVRVFVRLRESMIVQRDLAIKLDELERKVGVHDEHLRVVLDALRRLTAEPEKPKRRIGFTAQEKNAYYKIG